MKPLRQATTIHPMSAYLCMSHGQARVTAQRTAGLRARLALFDNLVDVQWIAKYANRLRQQWPRVDVAPIDETALELWRVERLRKMSGEQTAALWWRPLQCDCGSC